ncbi:MAG TPA: hypothetical protein VFR78_07125 [Pyrinomonadaceae bacterium]|nr:hypothetical protein [Pyrinomonadaceae bacterium]
MNSQRLTCLIVILLCAVAAHAQSGRRQTKRPPAAPVPTPTPEPSPTAKTETKDPELEIFLGADRDHNYGAVPWRFYDAALRGCADRLRQKSGVAVDVSQNSVSRGDAIKKAKSSDNTYVILIILTFDAMARSYDDLQLHFTVFAPTTSKVVTTGIEYLNGNRVGPVVAGRTSRLPGAVYREEVIRHAGEQAADRSWKAINKRVAEAPTKLTPRKASRSHLYTSRRSRAALLSTSE